MNRFSLAAALAALLITSTAMAQAKGPPLDKALAEKATPAQEEAFAACVENGLKQCPRPKCKAGPIASVRKCNEEMGRCQDAKIRECAPHLGATR